MGGQQSRASRIVCETVRPYADADLLDAHMGGLEMAPHTPRRSWRPGEAGAPLVSRSKHGDGVLAAIGREDEIGVVGDQRARHRAQVRDGRDVLLRLDVDHVDGIVRGVGDVDPPGRLMHGGVIEAAGLRVLGQIDEPSMSERHVSARPRARPPAARRWPRCASARPRSRHSPPARPTARRAGRAGA